MAVKEAQQQTRVIWSWFPVTLLTAIFCCVLWGSASPAIKIAYELFRIGPDDTASRIMLAGARYNSKKISAPQENIMEECYHSVDVPNGRTVLLLFHGPGTHVRCTRIDHQRIG